ncbi:flavodoxin family protein [Oricola indica]|jgi:NAD(P)H dehydrogenase (quinone)|uniref:flavodoxin family protein n=1 Tax=Oricola indica TaxID=2872591 RepID=UPI001CBBDCCB|nr:flavodoxin family protein [Oricola indica]
MGKILIIYDTDSDRRFTETMVPFVREGAESVGGMELRVRFVDDAKVEDVFWADGIAIGCPTHLGGVSWRMKKWWDDRTPDIWFKTDGKFAVPFTSAGSLGGGGELACQALSTMMLNMGYFVFGITDYVAKKESLHYGAVVAGEPREDHAIESCRRAGRRLAEWVGYYMDGRKECHPLNAQYNRFWELAS